MQTLLTIKQVMQSLQVSRITLYRWIGEGKIRAIKIGGQLRIRPAELEQFLQENETTKEPAKKSASV